MIYKKREFQEHVATVCKEVSSILMGCMCFVFTTSEKKRSNVNNNKKKRNME